MFVPPTQAVLPQNVMSILAEDKIYRPYREGQDPEALFQEAREQLKTITPKQSQPTTIRGLSEVLTRTIYGSNMIEHVGLNLVNTTSLCEEIFSARNPPPGPPPELCTNQPEVETWSLKDIAIAKSEVIQHAKDYLHMIRAFVVEE